MYNLIVVISQKTGEKTNKREKKDSLVIEWRQLLLIEKRRG